MLRGIDISNNNKDLKLTDTSLLYVMKATQDTWFVDRYCDPWVQWCIANGVPWGFYHFMSKNHGVAEAEFFYRNTRNYFTHGVPILDFEQDGLTDEEAESFVWRIHELSGIWPLIYTYSDFINGQGHLKNSWVKDKCGLWLAGYPSRRTDWPSDATCPYPHAGWTLAMWQFTNCLTYNGHSVDGDVFYGDAEAWHKYALGDNEELKEETQVADIPTEENAVYRLCNPNDGQHMLTADHEEAVKLQSLGWTYESIAFYAART